MLNKINLLLVALCVIVGFAGCWGHVAIDAETVGQVKGVVNVTPLLCNDYKVADVSLGILRNGTGSTSKDDMYFTVTNAEQEKILKESATTGKLVKITFNRYRFAWCTQSAYITKVELLN